MTNVEARFNKSLRPRKPEGSLGRTAQDVHLDSHTAPELWYGRGGRGRLYSCGPNAQVLTTSYVRAIQFSPNQTRERKKERKVKRSRTRKTHNALGYINIPSDVLIRIRATCDI